MPLFVERFERKRPRGREEKVPEPKKRGNVAIFAQDVPTVRTFLPPDVSEIQEAMCALFIGASTVPTKDNIAKLSPVLVSKNRVATLIDFLVNENDMYLEAGVTFSSDNMATLFSEEDSAGDTAVPRGVELACLADDSVSATATSSYTDRGDTDTTSQQQPMPPAPPRVFDVLSVPRDEMVMEAVGYTAGESSAVNYTKMKATALAWCLDKKKYMSMRSSTKFISDRDPGLLTFNFPRLDPWGIGGFLDPRRTTSQAISFEHQVKNLLRHHDGAFQNDPSFAYVCWNIIQKKEVNRNIAFRTDAKSQADTLKDVLEIAPLLTDMMAKWEGNEHARPTTAGERKALKTLNKLKLVARDLKGSSGYKQSRRNEIRAMMKKMGTPALFITITRRTINCHLRSKSMWSLNNHLNCHLVKPGPFPR
ncbi:hypothetical protein C8J57DRAFT_1531266 [Mycena rebaudengoi]|nr:hypothetical protein C8J57DRAFT_1531266 [Mycena rebaudengoi]